MQRVRRAERKARQASGDYGFRYRRPLANINELLKATYPPAGRPAQDWPSAATVEVRMLVGRHHRARRPENLLVRVRSSRNEAEARSRALSKLRLPTYHAWLVCGVKVKPDGVPAVPSLRSVMYRNSPLFGMLEKTP